MDRPAVDLVVPFRGSAPELSAVRARLETLALGPADTVTVVDNSPHPHGGADVSAPRLQTPGFARNRGAERGSAEWLLFLDADVLPEPTLLDDYFATAPAADTGLLAGGVRDEPVGADGGPAARYSYLRSSMSQDMTLQHGEWAFVQTANCALRRRAFESVGGFREGIRAGEDADLCYRLRAAGWATERREGAVGSHRSRATVRALLAQKATHGAAGAWLDRRYPGSFPARRVPGLTWWGVRRAVTGVTAAARDRRRDDALVAVMDPLTTLAYELGRSLPNHRPLRFRR
ncbi:MAG TPA: glycosyltransferase family 2 protein [Thermoleophilaceae bacterium]|nr:glycosyltransferase family 2 protein [Thermoleophilaceae bacterium]